MSGGANKPRKRIANAMKTVAHLEMELVKCEKQVDSLNTIRGYIEKQLDSLKATAAQPKQLDRLEELKNIISAEEK